MLEAAGRRAAPVRQHRHPRPRRHPRSAGLDRARRRALELPVAPAGARAAPGGRAAAPVGGRCLNIADDHRLARIVGRYRAAKAKVYADNQGRRASTTRPRGHQADGRGRRGHPRGPRDRFRAWHPRPQRLRHRRAGILCDRAFLDDRRNTAHRADHGRGTRAAGLDAPHSRGEHPRRQLRWPVATASSPASSRMPRDLPARRPPIEVVAARDGCAGSSGSEGDEPARGAASLTALRVGRLDRGGLLKGVDVELVRRHGRAARPP